MPNALGFLVLRISRRAAPAALAGLLVAGPAHAQTPDTMLANRHGANLPMIDAHSQVDCNISEETVLRQLQRLRISRVLVSIRGCKGTSSADLEARSLGWAEKHPDRISALLSTKVDGWSFNDLPASKISAFETRARRTGFVGMGEILVQHAAHEHPRLSYPELALRLDDARIRTAIGVARSRSWPVTLHIELKDSDTQAAQTLADLRALLDTYPDTPFLLIHMGQASPDQARMLIENHSNIHFLTSTADDFAQHATGIARRKGFVAQSGWINLFQGNCQLTNCPAAWKPAWKILFEQFPARFVLAFDNVFPQHWEKPFAIKVGIWRRALAKLPRDVAHAVAHGNAERLWKLPAAN